MSCWGKGVGFKQHPGVEVDRRIVVREFVPKNKVIGNQRYAMLADVPVVYLEVVEAILEKFQELVHTELDEGVYLDLVDHISFGGDTAEKRGLVFIILFCQRYGPFIRRNSRWRCTA